MRNEIFCMQNSHEDSVLSLAVTRDNKFIISGSADKAIKVWDLEDKLEIKCFKDAHEDWIN